MSKSNLSASFFQTAFYCYVPEGNGKYKRSFVASGTPEQAAAYKRGDKPSTIKMNAEQEILHAAFVLNARKEIAGRPVQKVIGTPVYVLCNRYLEGGKTKGAKRDSRLCLDRSDLRDVQAWVKAFQNACDGMALSEVTPVMVENYVASLVCAEKTRLNRRNVLRSMFEFAVSQGLIAVNPFSVKSGITWESHAVPVSPEDNEKVLANCSPEFAAIWRFVYATGCRPGEACKLTGAHYHDGCFTLKGATRKQKGEHKNAADGRDRLIDLAVFTSVRESTEALIAARPSGCLFLQADGTPWTPEELTRIIYALRQAGLVSDDCTMYGCRHAVATRLAENDCSLQDIADSLGNSPKTLQKCYLHKNAVSSREKRRQRMAGKASA